MPSKTIAFPHWKIICTASLLLLGGMLVSVAQAQEPAQERAPESREYQGNSIPSATAPAYGGAATKGGPGSINPATGARIPSSPPPLGDSGAGKSATPQQAVSNADRNLMRMLAEIHMAEVDMGKMAQTRSDDIQVRSFAQGMIDDHGAALEQLQQMAEARGILLPGGPGKRHAAVKEKLTALTGDQFSRQYLQYAGDTAHREAHQLLQQLLQQTQDPQLRAQAGTSLALVEQHFQMGNQVMAAYRQGQEIQASGASQPIQDEAPRPASGPQQQGVPAAPGSPPR